MTGKARANTIPTTPYVYHRCRNPRQSWVGKHSPTHTCCAHRGQYVPPRLWIYSRNCMNIHLFAKTINSVHTLIARSTVDSATKLLPFDVMSIELPRLFFSPFFSLPFSLSLDIRWLGANLLAHLCSHCSGETKKEFPTKGIQSLSYEIVNVEWGISPQICIKSCRYYIRCLVRNFGECDTGLFKCCIHSECLAVMVALSSFESHCWIEWFSIPAKTEHLKMNGKFRISAAKVESMSARGNLSFFFFCLFFYFVL